MRTSSNIPRLMSNSSGTLHDGPEDHGDDDVTPNCSRCRTSALSPHCIGFELGEARSCKLSRLGLIAPNRCNCTPPAGGGLSAACMVLCTIGSAYDQSSAVPYDMKAYPDPKLSKGHPSTSVDDNAQHNGHESKLERSGRFKYSYDAGTMIDQSSVTAISVTIIVHP